MLMPAFRCHYICYATCAKTRPASASDSDADALPAEQRRRLLRLSPLFSAIDAAWLRCPPARPMNPLTRRAVIDIISY